MAEFIDVYAKATGKKHRVPAHYMDNPRLAKPFRKTPKASSAETREMGSATPATDVATIGSSVNPSTTDTPSAGDKE